ncbi:MAG: SdrD B-like domain-containing protein [Bacteroidota bacterium]|nr:SdrD B-like domain-containing protein [Bacteroidota bacterium]
MKLIQKIVGRFFWLALLLPALLFAQKKNTVKKPVSVKKNEKVAPATQKEGTTSISEDIERKVSLSPYVGVSIFPASVSFNEFNQPKNVFGGFQPAPYFGLMAYYKLKKRFYVGLDGNWFITSRPPLHSMNVLGLGLFGKLNFLNNKKRINPYLIAGVNVSFVNYSQNESNVNSSPKTDSTFGSGIKAEAIQQDFRNLNLVMAPMFGPLFGLGTDIKLSRRFSIFFQGTVHTHFGNNPLIKKYFDGDNSVLQYLAIRGGLNIKLYKRMKFDIDSAAIRVPDLIVMLEPPEIGGEAQQQMLNREANFAVNIREGLKHNVQINTNSGEINIEIDQDTSKNPCPVLAVLYDQFGNKVATQKPGPDGKVHFGDLEKGVFNVAFELQPPCKEADFSYAINDPDAEIKSQTNVEYAVNDSLNYVIEGMVDFKDPNASKENVTVMLVDQKDKKIKSRMLTKSDGGFAFKNLTPGNYKVVYEVPNPNLQTRIAYDVKTNNDSLVKKVSFPFNEAKKSSEGTRLMQGKLTLSDPKVAAYKVNLDLIDKYNRVIDKSIPNKDGSFEFIDSKTGENEIIYDVTDKKIEENAPVAVQNMTYVPKVEEAKKLELEQRKMATMSTSALEAPKILIPEKMQMYKLYDTEGKELSQEGFGFQVGAFRNMANVQGLMDKLKSEGFSVFVQSVMSNDVNSRFKSSQNYRFNRVIVFGTNEENKANEVRKKLVDEGYTIIVKEHFSTKTDEK